MPITRVGYRDGLARILSAARKAVAASNDVLDVEKNGDAMIATVVSKALSSMLSAQILVDHIDSGRVPPPGLAANGNGQTPELGRLLKKRDVYKNMASKSSATVKFSLKQVDGVANNGKANNQKSKTIFDEHDPDLSKRFAETKMKHDSLLSKIDLTESRYNDERQATESELESCHQRKRDISAQKADLLRQLQLLEEEETALNSKEESIEQMLNVLSAGYEAEKVEIEKQLEQPKKIMKVARACQGVEDVVSSFQKSLTPPDVSSKVAMNGLGQTGHTTEKAVADFYAKMRNYFRVEIECVYALKTRVDSLCMKADKIVRFLFRSHDIIPLIFLYSNECLNMFCCCSCHR